MIHHFLRLCQSCQPLLGLTRSQATRFIFEASKQKHGGSAIVCFLNKNLWYCFVSEVFYDEVTLEISPSSVPVGQRSRSGPGIEGIEMFVILEIWVKELEKPRTTAGVEPTSTSRWACEGWAVACEVGRNMIKS